MKAFLAVLAIFVVLAPSVLSDDGSQNGLIKFFPKWKNCDSTTQIQFIDFYLDHKPDLKTTISNDEVSLFNDTIALVRFLSYISPLTLFLSALVKEKTSLSVKLKSNSSWTTTSLLSTVESLLSPEWPSAKVSMEDAWRSIWKSPFCLVIMIWLFKSLTRAKTCLVAFNLTGKSPLPRSLNSSNKEDLACAFPSW